MISNRRVREFIFRPSFDAQEIKIGLHKVVLLAMDNKEYDELGGYPADLLREAAIKWNKMFQGPADSIMYRVEGYTFGECVE